MDIPSLSVDRHDRYTPAVRDRVAEKLRTPLSDTAYHVLTPGLLRTLTETVSRERPVLSLCLQLTPERSFGGIWRTFLASMADATLKPIDDRRTREALREEFDRIEQAMHAKLPVMGRGVAFFTCRQIGLWRQLAVPLPLPDGVHRGPRPYLRPLVRTQNEHDAFVIALLTQELSRFFVSQIGQVQEVFEVRGVTMRRMLTDHGPKDRYDGGVLQAIRNEAHILAHTAEQVLTHYQGRYLLLAEAEDLRAAVIHDLGKDVQQRVGAEFSADIHARPSEVAAAAEPAQRAIEEREEVATVQRLLDAGPQRSAWGVQATLRALWEGKVNTLVVDDMFARPGGRCRECAALLEAQRDRCVVCESAAVEPVEDVVELAIEKTLDEDGAFEMVRSAAARQLLARVGPMAALLLW
jgi:hypothetical protein